MNFYLDTAGESIRYITPSATRYATGSGTCAIVAANGIATFTAARPFAKKRKQFVIGTTTYTIQTNAANPYLDFEVPQNVLNAPKFKSYFKLSF